MRSMEAEGRLSQEMADALIARINVFEGGNIEIVMKYQDVYADTVRYLEKIENRDDSVKGEGKNSNPTSVGESE